MSERLQDTAGIFIAMPGHMSEERPVGSWPDLTGITRLAQRHFDEISDPSCGHRAYIDAA
tara:strand:- start:1 stop:180 length:180 start_codon:yes stop_codon:yes gene_type:complete